MILLAIMTPQDFDSIRREVFGPGSAFATASQKQARLRELLPNDDDYQAFRAYSSQKTRNQVAQARTPAITAEDFVRAVDTQRLLSPTVYQGLVEKMTHSTVPWVAMGRNAEHTILYRLVPDPLALRPHDSSPPTTAHQVLPLWFLGMNEDVQPRQPAVPLSRRHANLSETSANSAESDDTTPGFVFFQLGKLEWVDISADGDTEPYRLAGADWLDTGFCVVARLSTTGYAEGIHVLADMFPLNGDTGKREQITGPDWGIPPRLENLQFSCARIGHRLEEMGFGRELTWTNIVEHPVELVWTKIMGDGRAMRATVLEDCDRM